MPQLRVQAWLGDVVARDEKGFILTGHDAGADGLLDEDAADRLGRGGEEMPAPLELLIADEAQIGFVNEGRGVECLPRLFLE